MAAAPMKKSVRNDKKEGRTTLLGFNLLFFKVRKV